MFSDVQSSLGLVNVTTPVRLRTSLPQQSGFGSVREINLTFQACDKVLMRTLLLSGAWEPDSIRAASLKLKENSSFGKTFHLIDIGANVGIFYIQLHLALEAMGLGQAIRSTIAIEPDEGNHECLEANLRRAGIKGFATVRAGVAPVPGEMVLYKDSNNPGNSSYVQGSVADPKQLRSVTRVDTFDHLTDGMIAPECPFFLKIDVQGFEPQVVQGISDRSWDRVTIFVIEITPKLLCQAKRDCLDAMLQRLKDFKLEEVMPSGTVPIGHRALVERIKAGRKEYFDVIGVRK
jgi:FkbM family methyltransferase